MLTCGRKKQTKLYNVVLRFSCVLCYMYYYGRRQFWCYKTRTCKMSQCLAWRYSPYVILWATS